jgi:hypothetical protein
MLHSKSCILSIAALVAGAVATPVAAAGPADRCEPAGRRIVVVSLTPPASSGVAGVKIRLDYPEDAVAIPGHVDDTDVKTRVTDMPSGVLGVPNDEDDALVVALVSTTPLPAGPVFTVALDACRGARPAAADRFRCAVEQASNENGELVDGARCTITLRDAREGERS